MRTAKKTIHEHQFEQRCTERGFFSTLIRIADEMLERGQEKLSAKAIFEEARRQFPGLDLNNSHTSAFARRAMRKHKRLRGRFETREMRADVVDDEPRQLSLFADGEGARAWSGEEH